MSPQVTSVVVSNDTVPLSLDVESAIPVEITLYGSNLETVTSVEFDSGEDVSWVVASVSAGSTSVLVTAYAFGTSAGAGFVATIVNNQQTVAIKEVAFEFPILD
jgi:hypothetical protein